MNQSEEVLKAAAELVEYFGAGAITQYFNCFSIDADFIFYTHNEKLSSRAAYEDLWKEWEKEMEFRVLSCTSSNQNVRLLDSENAVFTHNVSTRLSTKDGQDTVHERETIIFGLIKGKWLAVHEHLSPQSN